MNSFFTKVCRLPKSLSFRLQYKLRGHVPPVYNCVIEKGAKPQKRALLAYITTPFRLLPDNPTSNQFSNNGIAKSIVKTLNRLNYIVDIIEYSDIKFRPKKNYEFFIGHLGYNFEAIADSLPSSIPKIYFATTPHWAISNAAEEARFNSLEERRGVRLKPDRHIEYSEDSAYKIATGIICLGNASSTSSYNNFKSVWHLNNAAYHDNHFELTVKDYEAGRKRFLFFSGPGNVHKGLDLLLEAFSKVNAELFICQQIEADFRAVYNYELMELPNIHLVGHIWMRTPEFYNLVECCNFVILPSCGEGQPGSVVECMHQGLIPVVSEEDHIDTLDYGVTLKNTSVEEIVKVVQQLTQESAERCQQMSQRTREAALRDFSEKAFLENMELILAGFRNNNRR